MARGRKTDTYQWQEVWAHSLTSSSYKWTSFDFLDCQKSSSTDTHQKSWSTNTHNYVWWPSKDNPTVAIYLILALGTGFNSPSKLSLLIMNITFVENPSLHQIRIGYEDHELSTYFGPDRRVFGDCCEGIRGTFCNLTGYLARLRDDGT